MEHIQSLINWLGAKAGRGVDVYIESLPSMAHNFLWLLVISAVAFGIEILHLGWASSSLKRVVKLSGTVKNDLLSLVMNYSGLGNYVALLMTFFIVYFFVKFIRAEWLPQPVLHFNSPLLAGLLYILVADFSMYWFHRFSHKFEILWSIHAYHHSASEMTILSGAREHPLVFPLISIWMTVPTAFIAPQKEEGWLLAVLVLTRVHGLLIHSNIAATWGWIGRNILVPPAMHRIHHDVAPQFHDSNYGSLLTLWDRLFGTWKSPHGEDIPSIKVGLADIPGDTPPLKHLLQTYQTFLRSLLRLAKSVVSPLIQPSKS